MSTQATSLKRCPSTGCDGACNQGRDCAQSLEATRKILRRITGLRQEEGKATIAQGTQLCTACPGYCPNRKYCHQPAAKTARRSWLAAFLALFS